MVNDIVLFKQFLVSFNFHYFHINFLFNSYDIFVNQNMKYLNCFFYFMIIFISYMNILLIESYIFM